MRKIVDFFIKNTDSLTFTFLLLFSLIQIIDKNYFHNSKFNFFTNSFVNTIKENKLELIEYFELKKTNQSLINENSFLRNNTNLYLKDSFNFSQKNYLYTPAKIISNSIKFSKNFITINKGTDHNIKVDDGVISNNGIIGVVNNTSPKFSTLISILNTDLNINTKVKNTNHFGSLNWDADSYEFINLYDIPKNANIKIGDTIISGGMSSIFPENVPIGFIKSYNLPSGNNYYDIKVKLFEDIASLKNIYVVKNNFKYEIKNLERNNE